MVIISDASALSDDGIAIAMLTTVREIDIKLIVATSGNVWAEEVAQNVHRLIALLRHKEISICVGLPASAFKERQRLFYKDTLVHGAPLYSGALGHKLPMASESPRLCGDLFYVISALNRPDLVVLGPASPLTPIIRDHTDLIDHIGHVYLMGGAVTAAGNATPLAEFNFWFDPDAAETLLASNLPITLLPLDVSQHLSYPADFAAKLDARKPASRYVRDCIARVPRPPICDELLAAVLINRNLIRRRRKLKLAVETSNGRRYGAVTLLDDSANRRPVDVIEEISQPAYWNLARRIFSIDINQSITSPTCFS
jgi:inosine-uridine nucleoside N-ribohydrolase